MVYFSHVKFLIILFIFSCIKQLNLISLRSNALSCIEFVSLTTIILVTVPCPEDLSWRTKKISNIPHFHDMQLPRLLDSLKIGRFLMYGRTDAYRRKFTSSFSERAFVERRLTFP